MNNLTNCMQYFETVVNKIQEKVDNIKMLLTKSLLQSIKGQTFANVFLERQQLKFSVSYLQVLDCHGFGVKCFKSG